MSNSQCGSRAWPNSSPAAGPVSRPSATSGRPTREPKCRAGRATWGGSVPESGSTVREISLPTLQALARVLGIDFADAAVAGVFDAMACPWGETRPSALPMSDVSPDGSPIEFAIDLHPDAASVQIAVEPMATGDDDTPANRTLAARSAVARIARGYGADLSRWDAIAGLYLPEDAQARHVAMLGAEIGRSQNPSFKVWLYPGICGIGGAP